MLQRLIAAVLGVLGLAAIALGIASATVWRADDTLTARAQGADGSTLVTTAPGVLELGGAPATVRVTAEDGAKVVIAVGRDTDVTGWVGTDAHTVITGLSDWHTLATDEVAGPEAPAPAEGAAAEPAPPASGPDPDGSDLWVLQSAGEGAAELTWTPQEGRWTAVAASVGEAAGPPVVELSWPQTVTTPWLVPGVVGGAVLLLLGLLLALRVWRAERAGTAGWHPVTTGSIPVAGGVGGAADDAPTVALSRRQIRDAAAAAAAAAAASAASGPTPTIGSRLRSLATGELPTVRALPPAAGAPAASAAGATGDTTADAVDPRTTADTPPPGPQAAEAPGDPGPTGPGTAAAPGAGRPSAAGTADRPSAPPSDRSTAPGPVRPSPQPATSDAVTGAEASTARGVHGEQRGAAAQGSSGPGSGPARPPASATPGAAPGSPAEEPPAASADPPVAPADPSAAPTDAAPVAGGSRADAWRRAWGFPGADGATPPPSTTSDDETDGERS